jgi:two-component system, cell cycle sensor histidine kinase and response regulator CckA
MKKEHPNHLSAREGNANRYRTVIEETDAGYFFIDREGIIRDVNKSWVRLYKYSSAEEVVGKHFLEIQRLEDVEDAKRLVSDVIEGGAQYPTGEFSRKCRDGSIGYHTFSVGPAYQNGEIVGIEGFIIDITEHKNAENALFESQERYRKLFDTMGEGVVLIDAEGNILEANRSAENILGLMRSEIESRNYVGSEWEIIRPDGSPMPAEEMAGPKAMNERRPVKDVVMGVRRPDGAVSWISVSATPLLGEDGELEGVVSTFTDITERRQAELSRLKSEEEKKRIEEQLYQAQKMESVGRLAGGVAHDFNNILTSVMGYAELLKMEFDDSATNAGQAVDIILKGARRAADLTQKLLGFARHGKYNPVPLDLNEVLGETMDMLAKIFEMSIDVTSDLDGQLLAVLADRSQVNQVLSNLIINARDAMPDGGTLVLKTENTYVAGRQDGLDLDSGNYVRFSISDSGIGMSPETRERIFEPFFTTKDKDRGTGLGLATVYGIVKNHRGEITVHSEPMKGTTFAVYLPASNSRITIEEPETAVPIGNASILVIDDEEQVRSVAGEMLRSAGHSVLVAASGREAIDIFRTRWSTIDAVLLDMIMPGIDGRETFRALREIDDGVKVILSSGYSQTKHAQELLGRGAAGYVQKPFSLAELTSAVSEALGTMDID